MMVLNTVKTLSLVVDLIFLAVAVFAIIKAPFLKQPLFAGPLGDLVGGDDEDDADYALEDAGGSTDGVVTLADAPFQNVNVNRLRDALYQAVAQQVLDFKAGVEHVAYVHEQLDHNDRPDAGQRDCLDPGPAPRAVDLCRLIERGIDGCDSRQINNCVPAGFFPDIRKNHNAPEQLRVGKEIQRLVQNM